MAPFAVNIHGFHTQTVMHTHADDDDVCLSVWGTVWVFPAGDLPVLSSVLIQKPLCLLPFLILLTSLLQLILLPSYLSFYVNYTPPSIVIVWKQVTLWMRFILALAVKSQTIDFIWDGCSNSDMTYLRNLGFLAVAILYGT